jgi:hypothetical protein
VIEDPDRALDASLEELDHWQWAPFNRACVGGARRGIRLLRKRRKEVRGKILGQPAQARGIGPRRKIWRWLRLRCNRRACWACPTSWVRSKRASWRISQSPMPIFSHNDKAKIYATLDRWEALRADRSYLLPILAGTCEVGVDRVATAPSTIEVSGDGSDLSAQNQRSRAFR